MWGMGMNMGKMVSVAVGALLLGVMIGSFASRGKVRRLEKEVESLRGELARTRRAPANAYAAGLAGLMASSASFHSAETRAGTGKDANALGPTTPNPEDEGKMEPPPFVADEADGRPDDAFNRLDERSFGDEESRAFVAAWKLQAAQARVAFIEQARLDDDQQAAMEAVIEDLNRDIADVVDAALEDLDPAEPPEMRDMVEIMMAFGDVYLDTDDALREFLSDEQMAKAMASHFDIFSQIDPEVLVPLIEGMQEASVSSSSE